MTGVGAAGAPAGKENVRVCVRGRLPAGLEPQWQLAANNCVQREEVGSFHVDRVYSPGTSNEDVFADTHTIVDGVVAGISGGIFAYGVRRTAGEMQTF